MWNQVTYIMKNGDGFMDLESIWREMLNETMSLGKFAQGEYAKWEEEKKRVKSDYGFI